MIQGYESIPKGVSHNDSNKIEASRLGAEPYRNETNEYQQNDFTRIEQLKKSQYITIGLAVINMIVYLYLMLVGNVGNAAFMAGHGAIYPDYFVYDNQWWRLLTAMFLHFDAEHLINNMVMLCCIGSRVEKIAGHGRMLLIYFLSGAGGSLLSLYMMLRTGDYAVSAGASGAVFGLIGALLWLVIRNHGTVEGITTKGMLFMIVLSLYYGIESAGVDNWAHFGGVVTGFVFAIILYRRKRQNY